MAEIRAAEAQWLLTGPAKAELWNTKTSRCSILWCTM